MTMTNHTSLGGENAHAQPLDPARICSKKDESIIEATLKKHYGTCFTQQEVQFARELANSLRMPVDAPVSRASENPIGEDAANGAMGEREACKPIPERTGVGDYCQPGDRREPRWIVMYDDADRTHSVFEDEQDARDCFAASEDMGWNCWLFSPTARAALTAEKVAPHSDDLAVDRFAAAMKEKMAAARAKGRGGWEKCSPEYLTFLLREHVEKGDPRDVANFCMMLWHLESRIFPLSEPSGAAAQAEPIYQWRYVGENSWRDVSVEGFGARKKSVTSEDMRFRIVYAAPPAQTQVALTDAVAYPADCRTKEQLEAWAARLLFSGNKLGEPLMALFNAWSAEVHKLADAKSAQKFAGMVLKAHRNDGYPGDVDGGFLQQAALDCGLIEERTATEPCGEGCTCAEVADFPMQCYFNTDSGRAAIAQAEVKT
ncbi:hypothetical protein R69746_05610 [Paraburkholderia aspalathi]|uniref:hypothetical protein n=1 Tax=Paraburkholderia aspalathi TaxID=1324617 RepID=UPI001B292825|nr:hypothetical protein [Paraburkholderia aspalathi]CAE6810826.1 hypothetical protein R69746_05610 [Paraburkholderia aspalathi]